MCKQTQYCNMIIAIREVCFQITENISRVASQWACQRQRQLLERDTVLAEAVILWQPPRRDTPGNCKINLSGHAEVRLKTSCNFGKKCLEFILQSSTQIPAGKKDEQYSFYGSILVAVQKLD